MENKNVSTNLLNKQMNQSDAMGYNLDNISTSNKKEFELLGAG